jgi:hypothetical protein
MTQTAAFRACYADWKLIKTRGVVQVVMEIPLSDADAAYQVLGGMPDAAKEQWFGVAALKPLPVEEVKPALPAPKRDWRDIQPAQQAGIRSSDPLFIAYLKEQRPDDWHEAADDPAACIRLICDVRSRVELGTDHKARVMWHSLDNAFQAWAAKERS